MGSKVQISNSRLSLCCGMPTFGETMGKAPATGLRHSCMSRCKYSMETPIPTLMYGVQVNIIYDVRFAPSKLKQPQSQLQRQGEQ